MFPSMIVGAETLDVISNGIDGTRNGSMQLMHAEIQLPTPLVPVREYKFIRFCKQHADGKWAVVDFSFDFGRNCPNGDPNMSCKKLPSGCILQDMPNGFCKITWVDHSQYDESPVHQIYRPLVNSGMAFGAHRWVATLKRHCESHAILMSAVPSQDPEVICPSGKRTMSKLAQHMSDYFWSGICPSSASQWDILPINNLRNGDIRFMSRLIQDASGENRSIVLSASTSVWMPVSRKMVFDFLCDAQMRGEWDVLSNGEHEMVHIAKGEEIGNSISILANSGNMLYLQDSWTDSFGSMIVYSPISMESLSMLLNGGDPSFVPLFPSGFSILPDGHSSNNTIIETSSDGSGSSDNDNNNNNNNGCLLTFGLQLQILLDSQPTSKFAYESVESINELISCTIKKVKEALGVE
ncbi:homeobox-leucine zipper protein anthocyaninless 2-like [Trifolium pratense]|uniref:Homeobox-leucine zipper protein anthocyaninless 2-like n=1 Tax=Trifolium pratense TaxID=57577 RepID=A0A2K3PK06_TRIPR|nr:homeobox-leucine zipper protein anthocyaninless 2-like [Trifolium pratense]